eukprot:TRINITY_DN14852_c1_g1_i1.p2 TRINITY_DN14852_c1_g1~~TRINITY_DN14852_c1_g1_i1.p2  ORF type:complete len:175 (+),score=69.84 TRINITY_DN14852_c1_g1_i1:103-627(+)
MASKFFISLAVFSAFVFACSAINCKPNVGGKQYDFTGLKPTNGSYLFQAPFNGSTWWFQVNICDNVHPQTVAACTVNAPVNLISLDQKTCIPLGSIDVSAWDETPYKDGAMLTMFHGAMVDNITFREARIYFTCDTTNSNQLSFEHYRDCINADDKLALGAEYHFGFATKAACV